MVKLSKVKLHQIRRFSIFTKMYPDAKISLAASHYRQSTGIRSRSIASEKQITAAKSGRQVHRRAVVLTLANEYNLLRFCTRPGETRIPQS